MEHFAQICLVVRQLGGGATLEGKHLTDLLQARTAYLQKAGRRVYCGNGAHAESVTREVRTRGVVVALSVRTISRSAGARPAPERSTRGRGRDERLLSVHGDPSTLDEGRTCQLNATT